MLYIIVLIVDDTLTSNTIPLGVISSTDQSSMNLLFFKSTTHQELLSDWPIYLTGVYMIGRSKVNDRLLDPKRDVDRMNE